MTKKPKEFIFSITNRCNLKCAMCDIPKSRLDELSTAELRTIISDASRFGFTTFVFSGGEPLLRKDIFELIAYAKRCHLCVCLTSNGCLIDEANAKELADSGVDVVNISIDGSRKVHDQLRGEGTFSAALKGLENLKKHGVETTVATMVCRQNIYSLVDVIELARNYSATTIKFQPYSAIFLESGSENNGFFIEEKDIQKAKESIENTISLAKRYNLFISPEDYLRRIPAYLSGKPFGLNRGCSALWTTCSVNARGDIFPCWVFSGSNTLVGNIKSDQLLKVWDSQKHRQIRQYIIEQGCPGCMMSCYDQDFAKSIDQKNIFMKLKKLKDIKTLTKYINLLFQRMRNMTTEFRQKYRFYSTYRGSLGKVGKRVFQKAKKMTFPQDFQKSESSVNALDELIQAKNKLKRELEKYQ